MKKKYNQIKLKLTVKKERKIIRITELVTNITF